MGIFYAVLSGIMVLIQGPVLREALQKFSEEKLVIIGSIILVTNFILFVSNETLNLCGRDFICSWKWTYVAIFHVNTLNARGICISRSNTGRCK